MTAPAAFVALVPGAGRGERVGGAMAKQYLRLGKEPMLAITLKSLLVATWIEQVHVIVAPTDTYWQQDLTLLELSRQYQGRLFWHRKGGATRQETVAKGLACIEACETTWVMVHDAARPGLSVALLEALRDAVTRGADGALLALPVADTVKSARPGNEGLAEVAGTVPRERLWLAQTPQVFRHGQLAAALEHAGRDSLQFTDEASVMESTGMVVRLIAGHWRNMKVTTAGDLELMALALNTADASPRESKQESQP